MVNPSNGNWTNQNIEITSNFSDSISGIEPSSLAWSDDNTNWHNYSNTSTTTFKDTWSGEGNRTGYNKVCDYAGNCSTTSTSVRIDKTAPTIPTVTYNSGSNSCSWKNNYNLTLNSSDSLSGVRVYQVDWMGDNASNSDVVSNFIPWNGYSSCNNRFRAVDNAGNVSEWTEVHHIHMDTEKPVHTNWRWGTVNKDIAQLYIQVTDNIGISRVQCPTSTATGGYNNWHLFDAVWDSSQNAYRCDITPSTFEHYNQTYATHLYIYDQAGNGGYYNATNVNIPSNGKILKDLILSETVKGSNITWVATTSWQESDASGLYSQSTSKGTTYYFRGNPTNNYVKFADRIWRIVRVNEDGTIRLITQDSVILNQVFNSSVKAYDYNPMYYTNSEIKTAVENWYKTNITDKGFDGKVNTGGYFCEQAKVSYNSNYNVGNATVVPFYYNYTPSFDCTTDGNGKGVVSGKVGLITIDEVLFAGGAISVGSNFYLKPVTNSYWTMSSPGAGSYAYAWYVGTRGETNDDYVFDVYDIRLIINLSADTLVSGSGTESDPYVVK